MRTQAALRLRPTLSALALAGGALLSGGPAHADVISPDQAACSQSAKGARCEMFGTVGHCGEARCCRNDYSNGPPPTQVCSPCLRCVAGPAPATPATTAPATPSTEAGAPSPFPATPSGAAPSSAPATAPASTGAAPAPLNGPMKAGCLAAPGAPGPLGGLGLLGGLVLAFGLWRGRRR